MAILEASLYLLVGRASWVHPSRHTTHGGAYQVQRSGHLVHSSKRDGVPEYRVPCIQAPGRYRYSGYQEVPGMAGSW